jgi:hypothetical protein
MEPTQMSIIVVVATVAYVYYAHLIRFHMKTETETSPQNAVLLNKMKIYNTHNCDS